MHIICAFNTFKFNILISLIINNESTILFKIDGYKKKVNKILQAIKIVNLAFIFYLIKSISCHQNKLVLIILR